MPDRACISASLYMCGAFIIRYFVPSAIYDRVYVKLFILHLIAIGYIDPTKGKLPRCCPSLVHIHADYKFLLELAQTASSYHMRTWEIISNILVYETIFSKKNEICAMHINHLLLYSISIWRYEQPHNIKQRSSTIISCTMMLVLLWSDWVIGLKEYHVNTVIIRT